ncbi:MAG TPA: hypothetical protein VEG62_07385, partial [Acidimicrobiales bacterium]|nr:hypothetical protein [Acidimicrobiales bacterium]
MALWRIRAEGRHKALSLLVATTVLAGTFVGVATASLGSVAGAATAATRTVATSVSTNGQWPGVGKICESGAGGASSVRGVGDKSID